MKKPSGGFKLQKFWMAPMIPEKGARICMRKGHAMKFRDCVAREFSSEPIQTSIAFLTFLGTVLGVTAAALFSDHSNEINIGPNEPGQIAGSTISVTNSLLVLAFFLAASFSGASVVRILGKYYPFHAVVLSVMVASFTAFASVFMFHLLPPRTLTDQAFASATSAAHLGTVVVFLAINGFSVARDLVQSQNKLTADDGKALMILALLLMLGWGALVAGGQRVLINTFIKDMDLLNREVSLLLTYRSFV